MTGRIMISVVLIEDNRLLREGLAEMIGAEPDLEVIAALRNGTATLARVSDLRPYVVLLDVSLSDGHSLHLVESIKKACTDMKLILMNLPASQKDLLAFITAGVSGFLMKEATLSECLNAIRSVAGGTNVLPPCLVGPLFSAIVDQAAQRPPSLFVSGAQLTRRERDIVKLIADGLSNKEIAGRLNLATFTVKSHVHNILQKSGLHTRLQLVSCAHLTHCPT